MSNTATRPHLLLVAAALLCLLIVQVATASGGEQQATASKGVSKKKFKKLKKRVKALEQQGQQPGPQGAEGPQGPQGPQGPSGQDATKLFAYVGASGNLIYGSGATDASQSSTGEYEIAFNQDLEGCVALANEGRGDPDGAFGTAGGDAVAKVTNVNPDDTVEVDTFSTGTGQLTNRAFMLAVFC